MDNPYSVARRYVPGAAVAGVLIGCLVFLLYPPSAHATVIEGQYRKVDPFIQGTRTIARAEVQTRTSQGMRYNTLSAEVPNTRILSGALNAAARGIRHPAFLLGLAAYDLHVSESGEIYTESEADILESTDGNVFVIDSIENTSVRGVDGGGGGSCSTQLSNYESAQPNKVFWSSGTTCGWARCDGDPVLVGPLDLDGPGFSYTPHTAMCYLGGQIHEVPNTEIVEEQVPESTVLETLTPEQFRRILTDIVNSDDPDHEWHDDPSANNIDTGRQPVPPEVNNVFNTWLTDITNIEEGTTDGTEDPGRTPEEQLVEQTEWPEFCNWATPVCSFFEWFQEDAEPPEDPVLPTEEVDDVWEDWDSGLPNTGACPAPYVTEFMGETIQIPFDDICWGAESVFRPLLISLSLIAAGFILVGARGKS